MTAVAVAIVMGLRPPAPVDERMDSGIADAEKSPEIPKPTIVLPATPATFEAGELRNELKQSGQDLLKRYPELPAAIHAVALLDMDLQQTQEAVDLWRQCIELDPKHAGPYVGFARAAMELGNDEEAKVALRKGLAAGCSSPEIYYELTAALIKLSELEEAEAVAQQGLAAFPKSAPNWLQLGQVQLQRQRFPEAEKSLTTAKDCGEKSDTVYFSLASACAAQGKTEDAAKYRQEFAARKAQQSSASEKPFQSRYDAELRNIAVAATGRIAAVYERQGAPAEAERLLMRSMSLDPQNPVVCGEFVTFLRKSGRIADALLAQRRLTEIEPAEVRHYINLASLASETGDLALAESASKQVVSMRPDLAIGYVSLAQLYFRGGDFKQAKWFAESALKQQAMDRTEALRACGVLAESSRAMGDETTAAQADSMIQQLMSDSPKP